MFLLTLKMGNALQQRFLALLPGDVSYCPEDTVGELRFEQRDQFVERQTAELVVAQLLPVGESLINFGIVKRCRGGADKLA